jgi:hypothetical protein
MIPSAINNKYTELPHGNNICREQWDDVEFETGYAITLLILLLVGPVIIMGISYMLIAMTLYIGMKMDCQSEPGTCIALLVLFNIDVELFKIYSLKGEFCFNENNMNGFGTL